MIEITVLAVVFIGIITGCLGMLYYQHLKDKRNQQNQESSIYYTLNS